MLSLRQQPYVTVIEELTTLSGVGPKVAACIALFSCDQHAAIPVDTHVWKLASKYYLPSVKAKTLTPKLHPVIMQARPAAYARMLAALQALAHGRTHMNMRCTAQALTMRSDQHSMRNINSRASLKQALEDLLIHYKCGHVQAFVDVFGEYAGWAHNALFISELASQKHHLEGPARSDSASESDSVADAVPATVADAEQAAVKPAAAAKVAAIGRSASAEAAATPLASADSPPVSREARQARRAARVPASTADAPAQKRKAARRGGAAAVKVPTRRRQSTESAATAAWPVKN